jgi:hypothetical protein
MVQTPFATQVRIRENFRHLSTNYLYALQYFLTKFWWPERQVQSQAINFGRQGHSLTQSKMLHCKTVVNIIITYHHVV